MSEPKWTPGPWEIDEGGKMQRQNSTPQVIAPQPEALWNKDITAKYLGISTKTLDRWNAEGRGPKGRKVGFQTRYIPSDVQEFLASCATVGGGMECRQTMELSDRNHALALANAHLIKAAPDLYEACEAFLEAWEKSHQLEKTDVARLLALKAMAKARGEQA